MDIEEIITIETIETTGDTDEETSIDTVRSEDNNGDFL